MCRRMHMRRRRKDRREMKSINEARGPCSLAGEDGDDERNVNLPSQRSTYTCLQTMHQKIR